MLEPVTIVIPIWKTELTKYEEISFRQSLSILNDFEFSIVTYKRLDLHPVLKLVDEYDVRCRIIHFPKRYFACIAGYNQLMVSVRFYSKFLNYKYILICQLDCFVFKDELRYWLDQGYSYIGAPWLQGFRKAAEDAPIIGVGNGGFSLRQVRDHLRALFSFHYIESPHRLFTHFVACRDGTFPGQLLLLLTKLTIKNNTFFLFNDGGANEDFFWGNTVKDFPWFSVPDWKVAAHFSVEVQPKRFLAMLSEMPFGCHAWWSYDFDFWKPYIEKFGHNLDS